MYGRSGGGGYEAYGIDPTQGAVVVVRPDGYVGMIAPVQGSEQVGQYLSSFMKEL